MANEMSVKEFLTRDARRSSIQWFDHEIANLESALRDVKRYKADYEEACAKETEDANWGRPEDVISYAVGRLQQVTSGCRLDLAGRRMIEHVVARSATN